MIEKQLQLLEGVEKDGVIGVVRQGQAEERGEGKKEARKRLFWQSGQEIGRALVILHIFVYQICANMWKLQMCTREMKGWSDRRGQEERGKKAARKR